MQAMTYRPIDLTSHIVQYEKGKNKKTEERLKMLEGNSHSLPHPFYGRFLLDP
jgi:hypothetical protein